MVVSEKGGSGLVCRLKGASFAGVVSIDCKLENRKFNTDINLKKISNVCQFSSQQQKHIMRITAAYQIQRLLTMLENPLKSIHSI